MRQLSIAVMAVSICLSASGQSFQAFYKPVSTPLLGGDTAYRFLDPNLDSIVRWQAADVFNPAAIVRSGKVCLLFRAEDDPHAGLGGRTSRIGLAESDDGIHFTRHPEPVLYPAPGEFSVYDFPGGCEDPRVAVTEDGLYVAVYTSWNRQVPRLSVAFSRDLRHWQKKGPAFAVAHGGRFLDSASKSGSIITRRSGDSLVIARIGGRYWMYWGEHFVNLAWSENLHDWHPLLEADGSLKAVARPRPYRFDSHLTECGPPALLTDAGIVLIFNGRNATTDIADPSLPPGIYTVGKLIFDPADPSRLTGRSEAPLLRPDLPHEVTGQYKAGTTFAEGLVYFKGRWLLYYGTADSYVGLAVCAD